MATDLLAALVEVGQQARMAAAAGGEESGGGDGWCLETRDVRLSWRRGTRGAGPMGGSTGGRYGAVRLRGVTDGMDCVCRSPRLEVALAWVAATFPGALVTPEWQVRLCALPEVTASTSARPPRPTTAQ